MSALGDQLARFDERLRSGTMAQNPASQQVRVHRLLGEAPVDVPLVPTGTAPIQGVEHVLQPGSARLIVRYLVHEENSAYRWASVSQFATEERRVLVSPMDIQVESEGMIPTDPAIENYATLAGLASQPGDPWVVTVSGGSTIAATDDGHDHGCGRGQDRQHGGLPARPRPAAFRDADRSRCP